MKISLPISQIPFKNYFVASFIISVFCAIWVLFLQNTLPPQVPLFYGLAQGEEQLAPSWALIVPSLTSLAVLVLNGFLGSGLKDDFLKRTLILTAIAVTFFSVITTVRIVFLVGSF